MQRRRQHRGNATRAKSTGMQSGRPRAGSASSASGTYPVKGHRRWITSFQSPEGERASPATFSCSAAVATSARETTLPDEHLDRYMERKVATDRILDMGNEVLPPIVDRFIWQDSTEAACPWCKGETKVVQRPSTHDATVFRCPALQAPFQGWTLGRQRGLLPACSQRYFLLILLGARRKGHRTAEGWRH